MVIVPLVPAAGLYEADVYNNPAALNAATNPLGVDPGGILTVYVAVEYELVFANDSLTVNVLVVDVLKLLNVAGILYVIDVGAAALRRNTSNSANCVEFVLVPVPKS